MCRLFIEADSDLWVSQTRSTRIDGVVTSIRMEAFFWTILEEVAHRDGMSVPQVITRLYLEAVDADHDIGNFTSFLRVCCGRYLSLMADGAIDRNAQSPLVDLPADVLLAEERQREAARRVARETVAADL